MSDHTQGTRGVRTEPRTLFNIHLCFVKAIIFNVIIEILMTWASKRKFIYLFIFFGFVFGFGFMILYPRFVVPATCNDGKQNGMERGIDCGGSCSNVCAFDADKISVLWSRAFEVIPGRYNAVAYIENHNSFAAVRKIKYKFTFADKDNLFIARREGETVIPPAGKFAIFEAGIGTGNSVPVYTDFEFSEEPMWQNVSKDVLNQLKLNISGVSLEGQNTTPKLSANIKNNSFFDMGEMNIVTILYDNKGNAVSASRTYLEGLLGGDSKDITFTWPKPIIGNIVLREVIPMYDVFSVKLR